MVLNFKNAHAVLWGGPDDRGRSLIGQSMSERGHRGRHLGFVGDWPRDDLVDVAVLHGRLQFPCLQQACCLIFQ